MNELDELKEEHRQLGERIKALESWPKDGDMYWYASTFSYHFDEYLNSVIDNLRRAQGNFFKSEEEVNRELEYRKVFGELLHCEGRVPFRAKTINYCMVFNFTSMNISTTSFDYNACGLFNIYFESKEAAQASIEKVGEERIIRAAEWQSTRPLY